MIFPKQEGEYEVGQDVTELLGITKYEPPVPSGMEGIARAPFPTHLVSKTDETRVQVLQEELKEFRKCCIKISHRS